MITTDQPIALRMKITQRVNFHDALLSPDWRILGQQFPVGSWRLERKNQQLPELRYGFQRMSLENLGWNPELETPLAACEGKG